MFELVPKSIYIDFVGQRRFSTILSFTLAFIGLFAFFVWPRPNWSIDFEGGTEVEFTFSDPVQIEEVRRALGTIGISEDAVQPVGDEGDGHFLVRMRGDARANAEEVERVKSALTARYGADWVKEFRVDEEVGTRASVLYTGEPVPLDQIQGALAEIGGVTLQASPEENTFYVRLPGIAEGIHQALERQMAGKRFEIDRADSVGPKVGASLRAAGITSLVVSMMLMLVYVAFRFDFTFAPGAVLCLFHDVSITVGFFVLLRQEFGLSMISALLTLTGYSINDTIVVYDRIRENLHKYRKKQFGDLINDSINQTLSRTVITSGATALAMVPFLFLGGPVLRQFAGCMLFGIVIGTYSSIYVAAPMTMLLQDNQDRIKALVGFRRTPSPPSPKRAAP
jgi:preprotein translocase subunit SecF